MEFIEERGTNKHQKKVSLYKCKCGNEFEAVNTKVKSGHTTSCGCSRGEKHGDKGTRLYNIWSNMKARCERKNHPQYENYGGRGITVSDKWKLYTVFKMWAMVNGYKEHLTIDRLDNNKGYSDDNCRWVNHKVQNNNTRRNIIVDDTTLTLKCEELGINPKLVQARIREQGMSFDEAIKLPQNFRHYKISYRDKEYSLKELCNELNLKYGTVYKRIKKYGWSLEKALDCKACQWILDNKKNNVS